VNGHRILITLVLAVCFYALSLIGLKLWIYPGWSWKGYLGDLKSIFEFTALVSPCIVYLWRALKNKTPEQSLLESVRHELLQGPLTAIDIALGGCCVALLLALYFVGESFPSQDLFEQVDVGNWNYANEILTKLKQDPLRPEVTDTLETYVKTFEASEKEQLSESQSLRGLRREADGLLRSGYDMWGLNTLSFAEASRAVSLIETAPDFIEDAEHRLLEALNKRQSASTRCALETELGELQLAEKNYQGAQLTLEEASRTENRLPRVALITASLANIAAINGELDKSIHLFSTAEDNYPDGRKFVFYSNYGYVLLMKHDYPAAEVKLKRAISIRKDDLISYLNLALVHDAMMDYADAAAEYQYVVGNTNVELVKREALILKGRSAELGGQPFANYVANYLNAAGHVSSAAEVTKLETQPDALSALYAEMAVDLNETMTYGIENYITWFKSRSSAVGIPNLKR
jgi:tetratricopeptide (TPR) repeat protein